MRLKGLWRGLLFGIHPTKLTILGQNVADKTRQDIAIEMRKFAPAIDLSAQYIPVPGREGMFVIAIYFPVSVYDRTPYTYDGRPYYKVENTTMPMPREMFDERIRLSNPKKFSWELTPCDEAKLKDIDNKTLVAAIKESEPDIIITHHPADTNNDHLQTSLACQEAIRLFQRRPEVKALTEFWYMEVPSCTEWALNTAMNRFQPNIWVEVGKEGVEAKVKALGMYRGVMRPYPHPRSAEAIEGFAAYRGCQAGCVYAEAFEVVLRRY